MVTILNIGKKQTICRKCNSQLEYTQHDVQRHEINHDYLGDYDVVNGIRCPVCENVIKDK